LGSSINKDAEEANNDGLISIIPMRYSTIISKAKSRLFNLIDQLEKFKHENNLSEPSDRPAELFAI